MKKSSSKEFNKFLNQSATYKSPTRRSESTFNFKFSFLVLLWIFRVLVVFLPQNGYVQPDEFFQFTEPIAGDVLGVENLRVWEFNRTAPLRSMFFPVFFSLPAFQFMKNLYFTGDQGKLSAYFLLVGPRLLVTLASFFVDFWVYRLCRQIYSPSSSCKSILTAKTLDSLLAHASSYLVFIYYTHTFSNTVETILFGYLLVTIVESLRLHNSSKITYCKLAFISAFGFFNRPTFVVFAFVPLLYWLSTYSTNHSKASSKLSRSSWSSWSFTCLRNLLANSFNLLIPFILSSIVLILFDTGYHYGFGELLNAISELSIAKLSQNIVLTPFNFLAYNLQTKNLANHGLHPVWFHALVCMPWMFSILAIIWYIDLVVKFNSLIASKFSRISMTNSIVAILYVGLIFTVLGFSSRPHHEPRFLLPLVIPISCLFGYRLFTFRTIASLWFISNVCLVIFYGHVHQAGVVPSLFKLHSNVVHSSSNTPAKLFFARQYVPPRHLLAIPKHKAELYQIYDLSILEFPLSFEDHFRSIASDNSEIYLTLPSCQTPQLKQSLSKHFPNITLSLVHQHFPHFSAEDLEHSLSVIMTKPSNDSSTLSISSMWTRLRRAFSMNIWKLTWKLPSQQ